MSGISVSRSDRRRAEAVLRSVMAEAEALAEKMQASNDLTFEAQTPIGKATFGQIGRTNIPGLHIHRRAPWGWYADLLLKDMPIGMPDVIGTATSRPLASEEAARQAGVGLVAMVLVHDSNQPKKAPADHRHFDFYGVYLRLPLKAIETCAAAAKAFREEARTEAECLRRLEQVKEQFFGGGPVTPEAFDALAHEDQSVIVAACLIAFTLNGIFRAPAYVPDVEDWQG